MQPDSVAHYRIGTKLGEGGMGAVYRGTDTRLNREVAVKLLPDAFAADADRLARFTREAQLLASLNHPNIAAIYGVEDRALILELVEGPTLAERIALGPIPVDEALPIARQIAEALEYAHEKGIIHRDLKPSNVKITPEGRVKVLDFGLAKALTSEAPAGNPASSPTLTMHATAAGMIMGTAGYMSPEQAKGKPADRRADIWAFGVLLVEMLTGRALYAAETVSETLAHVLLKAPDLSGLPATLPPSVRRLIERCLERDPSLRLQHAGEARIVLLNPGAAQAVASPAPAPKRRFAALLTSVGIVAAFAAGILVTRFRRVSMPAPVRFQLPLFERANHVTLELSPDGRYIAFSAQIDGAAQLWVRPLDSVETRLLAGTEGATYPAWSPDSAFILFFADGKLKRIPVGGGPAQVICEAADARGAAWGPDGAIIFSLNGGRSGLYRTSAAGGSPVPLTRPKAGGSEYDRYPLFIPGTDRYLYLHASTDAQSSGVYLGSLKGMAPLRVLPEQTSVAYLPDTQSNGGWLLYGRDFGVLAQHFDPSSGRLTADPVQVAASVAAGGNTGKWAFSAASSGTLAVWSVAYDRRSQLIWMDREGKRLGEAVPAGVITSYALSPDEKRVAMVLASSGKRDVWIRELGGGQATRVTFHESVEGAPVWSPDGRSFLYEIRPRPVQARLYRKAADGSSKEELLGEYSTQTLPSSWSGDGKFVALSLPGLNLQGSVLLLPMAGSARRAEPYLSAGSAPGIRLAFSPDSRWTAYISPEGNENRVFVQTLPAGDAKWQVSAGAGDFPTWRRDGRELYYVGAGSKLMAVPVETGAGTFHAGTPVTLFALTQTSIYSAGYWPAADGKRFLVAVPADSAHTQPPLDIVLNWPSTLRRAAP